jgi:2-polyprenyl-3-methyl-5-hydroxy-6-metoxy-1,4-benzoquinol methylase
MIKYHQDHVDFDALHQNNIDRIQLAMIPAKSHVLEIGCATGYTTEYLARDKQCRVLGVEPVEEQAEVARKRGLAVITGLIDSPDTFDRLLAHTEEHGLFDAIFMSPVIEHIADPAATLRLTSFIGMCLRGCYMDFFKNFPATQFAYKAQPVHRLK